MATLESVLRKWAASAPQCAPHRRPSNSIVEFPIEIEEFIDFPAPQMVQNVLKFEDIPKFLPKYSSKNMIRAIMGPPIYQGQGLNPFHIVVILSNYSVEGQT